MDDKVILLLLVLFLGVCSSVSPGPRVASRFTISLDAPAGERWNEVVTAYSEEIKALASLGRKLVTDEVLYLIDVFGEKMLSAISYPYNAELQGMAEILDVNVTDIILLNTIYDFTAFDHDDDASEESKGEKACTSIIAEATNGTIFHGRNLDYSLVDILKNITITVDFTRGGKVSYTGTTFAGYIGLLTGQKPHKYTISLDERDKGSLCMNIIEALLHKGDAVVSFHIRDALASDAMDFEDVVPFLAYKPLIAPCYIIVGGTKSGEGVVITRDSTSQDLWRLNTGNGTWYLVETNYDHWDPPPKSDDRRDPAIEAMKETTRANIGGDALYNVLSTPPVLNDGTTYTVVMSAANPEMYTTWVRN